MARTRTCRRVALGAVAFSLAVGPLAVGAGAQDNDGGDDPPNAAQIQDLVQFYGGVLAEADIVVIDANGVPRIPQGEPGERDLTPENTPEFLMPITGVIVAQGQFDTEVAIDDGSELLGDCGGMAMSFDADGVLIDLAVGVPSREGGGPSGQLLDTFGDGAGERAFTSSNPFEVDDLVIYVGTLPSEGDGPLEHNWTIKTAGISIDSGGDPNTAGKNRNAGEVDVGSVPNYLRPAGIFPITGDLVSQNGLFCIADGWVLFTGGNPLLSAPSAVAALLGIGGIVGLLFNARPAITWSA
jgi:hypothetical protein